MAAQQQRGAVQVYSGELFNTLMNDVDPKQTIQGRQQAQQQQSRSMARTMRSTSANFARTTGEQMMNATRRRLDGNRSKLKVFANATMKQVADEDKRIKRNQEERKRKEEEKFQRMLKNLHSEDELIDNVTEYLQLKDSSDRRRKEQLYKDWQKEVFVPIQKQIQTELNSRATSGIEERRCKQYQEFLDATNKKDGLFRDIIIPEDYDPLRVRKDCIRYSTKKIADPVKADIAKREYEHNIVKSNVDPNHIPESVTREVLDILLWDKLEATPHGRYGKMFKNAEKNKRKNGNKIPPPPKNTLTKSSVVMDHYSMPNDQKLVTEQYFPPGKKVYPTHAAGRNFNIVSGGDPPKASYS